MTNFGDQGVQQGWRGLYSCGGDEVCAEPGEDFDHGHNEVEGGGGI